MSRPTDPIYVVVGGAIREARERIGMSQQDLAQSVGLTRSSITNLEHGRQQAPLHVLYAVAEALEVGVKDLLPDDRERTGTPQRRLGKEDLDRYRTLLAHPARTR